MHASVAIVKATYTRSSTKIKASVRYIQHRPGKDGERLIRQWFGLDGPLSRDEVYDLIDNAPKGTTFFRLVMSPDPNREDGQRDLDLRDITEQTLLALSEKLGQEIQYAGVIHDDHAPHRHVHVIALIRGQLTREHFKLLRQTATSAALTQRRQRDLERDLARGIAPTRPLPKQARAPVSGRGGFVQPKASKRCLVCGVENCLLHDNDVGLERTQ